MKKLFYLIKKATKFYRLTCMEKILVVEAFFLTGVSRFSILYFHFYKVASYLGKYNEESCLVVSEEKRETAKKIAWAVLVSSRYTPWKSKCLVQAITAQIMLKRRRLTSTLYLGVSKDKGNKPIAHAWLRSGTAIITGGYGGDGFTQVAKFSSEVRGNK